MHKFLRKLITEWRQLNVAESQKVILAISGGADSCALLAGFAQLRSTQKIVNECIVVHFNHELRGEESNRDEEFCRTLAESYRLPFISGRAGKPLSGNIEQAARLARYEFLVTAADSLSASCILTGHTIDDQAETFLINLFRGSGLKGLSAMNIERGFHSDSEVRLLRPLLRWASRTDTEAFCADFKIRYVEDSMNEDTSFNRVRIRKEILPLLAEFNPNIVETLNRTAETLLESHSAIKYLIGDNTTLNDAVSTEKLKLSVLVQLPPEVRRVIVRSWLSNNRGDLRGITKAHISAVVALAVSRKSGKTVELPRGGKIVKENGWLELE